MIHGPESEAVLADAGVRPNASDAAASSPDGDDPTDDEQFAARLNAHPRLEAWLGLREGHELTRFALLRLLAVVYTAAYASLALQVLPLIGESGITPARAHFARLVQDYGSRWSAFAREPSLFFFLEPTDAALQTLSIAGLALSIAVLAGLTNGWVMAALCLLYRSFITAGQLWYGYGWELLLVETGFLAIFLCPFRSVTPLPATRAPLAVIWLFRWLAFRLMLGAGLIKLRGDPCWTDLTCLDFHFETQPIPNPLSPLFHALPHAVHAGGVLFNHVAELLLPPLVFGPRTLRMIAGLGMIAFQLVLIMSGNLSFLNWLSIVPLLACFDDRALAHVAPKRLVERAVRALPTAKRQLIVSVILTIVVALLSIAPVANMASRRQRMNAAFDPLMLVNSYGAFGGVGRERRELIIEGTRASDPGPRAHWEAYELPFKPGDVARRPGVVSPLQPRLDWQLWFAAMASAEDEPWLLHVVWKLLHADPSVRRLLARDPFGDTPPKYVRIMRYRYSFAPLSARAHWTRELEGYWLPPLPADDILRDAMIQLGYVRP